MTYLADYHSQYAEDRWITDNLPLPPSGVFVDVGAEDGRTGSNTYHFEQLGWTGICIEPHPDAYAMLKQARSCQCVNVAIGSGPSTQPFYLHPGKGWSGLLNEGQGTPTSMPVRRLDDVLKEACIDHIDLLSIDTEGTELDVLSTIDLTKYHPSIIIIEWDTWCGKINTKDDILKHFATLPYQAAHRTPGNLIFVSTDITVNNKATDQRQRLWRALNSEDYQTAAVIGSTMLNESYAMEAMWCLGICAIMSDQTDRGLTWLTAGLSLSEGAPEWCANGVTILIERRKYAEADSLLQLGLARSPTDPDLQYFQAFMLHRNQDYQAAIDILQNLDAYRAKMLLAQCYGMLDELPLSLALFDTLYAITPNREELVNHHSRVLLQDGRPREALNLFQPEYNHVASVCHSSLLRLGLGDNTAWKNYRWRFAYYWHEHRQQIMTCPRAPDLGGKDGGFAINSLDDIKDKTIILLSEQGYGDMIQFMRYAPVLEQYAKEVIISVPKPLVRLAQSMYGVRSFSISDKKREDKDRDMETAVPPTRRVIIEGEPAPPHDAVMLMMDCPALIESIPSADIFDLEPSRPCHVCDHVASNSTPQGRELERSGVLAHNVTGPQARRLAPSSLQHNERRHLQVGVCWHGEARPHDADCMLIDKHRSIDFKIFKPLLSVEGYDFISLQMEPSQHRYLADGLAEGYDFYDTALVIQTLDLVITVDTAIAHLAASLGKPTWLLSRYYGCWRWRWDDSVTTPWYPTMRIFRQPAPYAWPEVIAEVKGLLECHAHDQSLGPCIGTLT